ncbi:AlpA family phage regulatory protein [Motiliproteus sp. MSK22-1]|uniref:helix-turn-helix transcriptional regulator n=1 Tax=Motiliproteus sp. MSK22-1 TaxID=1897630 RepID=UPI0009F9FA4C
MEPPFDNNLASIADSLGIGLYQRFSLTEASLFLRCPLSALKKLQSQKKIGYIAVPGGEVHFFGYQLLEYLLTSIEDQSSPQPQIPTEDRIVRIKEVQSLTGLSRTSLWREERAGRLPSRVALCSGSVGWRLSDIQEWIRSRK